MQKKIQANPSTDWRKIVRDNLSCKWARLHFLYVLFKICLLEGTCFFFWCSWTLYPVVIFKNRSLQFQFLFCLEKPKAAGLSCHVLGWEHLCFSIINILVNSLPIFNPSVFAKFSIDVPILGFHTLEIMCTCNLNLSTWWTIICKCAFAWLFIKKCSFCNKCRYLANSIRLNSQIQ